MEKKKKDKKALHTKNLKKYFNKQTFLGITIVGLLVFVLVYVGVYQDYVEKTETLERANMQLRQEIAVLEEYHRNREFYEQGIEEAKLAIDAILDEYPADAREEDILMLAVQIQEENNITYKSINMQEQESVYTVGYDVVQAAGIEGLDTDITFAQKHATLVNETVYADLKECIAQIYASDYRVGIDNIVYCKNQDRGTLEGNINLYLYSVIGTGKEYVEPDIREYISGTDNLFQSGR